MNATYRTRPLRRAGWLATSLLTLTGAAFSEAPGDGGSDPNSDIVDALVAAGNFDTLVGAVQAAGLESALRAAGPLTVFAPTDDAFAKVDPTLLAQILGDPDQLTAVLLYHVEDQALFAADVLSQPASQTLLAKPIFFSQEDDGCVFVNNSLVSSVDFDVSNGVIHAIEDVLIPDLPPFQGFGFEVPDVVQTLAGDSNFSTLLTAVQVAGLDPVLLSGTYTIFAPTNAAFDALPDGTLDALLKDPDALADVLLYHVVGGPRFANEVTTSTGFRTLQGERISFSTDGVDFFVNQARIEATDTVNANGVVHTIDSVLLPPTE